MCGICGLINLKDGIAADRTVVEIEPLDCVGVAAALLLQPAQPLVCTTAVSWQDVLRFGVASAVPYISAGGQNLVV